MTVWRRRSDASSGSGRNARPEPGHGARAGVPRYLRGSNRPSLTVQRDGDGTASSESGTTTPSGDFQLRLPSLLQPPDPYALFRPHFDLNLSLDPTVLQPRLQAAAAASGDAPVPAGPLPGTPEATTAPPPAAVPGVPATPSATTPATPAPAPVTPGSTAPGSTTAGSTTTGPAAGPATPRPGGVGDVLGAVAALPQVSRALEHVKDQTLGQVGRYWDRSGTGERVGFVTATTTVGLGIVTPLLLYPTSRDQLLPLLNGRVIPIPLLDGYGVEFNFGANSVMVGVHVDVGRLLPPSWGFGPGGFNPLGGPPQPQPFPDPVQRDAEDDEEAGPESIGTSAGVAGRIHHARGGGHGLDTGLRSEFEPALGADLAGVRVHHGGVADSLARDLHAHAFTVGNDIFFRAGRYDPDGIEGRRLLAHELAHTVQQATGPVAAQPLAAGLAVSTPGDAHEREADTVADAAASSHPDAASRSGAAPQPGTAPSGLVQRQPDGSSSTTKAAKPPAWTDYFDEVVPAVLAALDGNDKVGLERALWLVTQAYGEQSPGVVGPPSRHRNRLFNEQGAVTRDASGKITGVVPGQESEGVYLYNLPQNEAPEHGQQDIRTSPTFGYDTPERAASHHVEQLQARWGGAWSAMTDPKANFDTFAHRLKAAGYARAATYDTDLIALQNQVRTQVSAWLRYRVPELKRRIPQMEAYVREMADTRDIWRQNAVAGDDPVGSKQKEVARLDAEIDAMQRETTEAGAKLGRLMNRPEFRGGCLV